MPEILDQDALDGLLAMVGDDPEFVDELVDAYLDDAPRLVEQIRTAISSGVAADVVRPAHTLKGSSASIGAREVEGVSRTIEERSRAEVMDGLGALADDLDAAVRRLVDVLDAARARRWAAP